ncbi:acetoacetate decarboxylase family protein [Nitrincola sp. MINF-07-Sa-05]|uniref:acetoacetate decarboxylase family protein n=1 Tax=Nitrincola salilacus TaxID=3400273 RepID=UPI0039180D77
MSDQTPYARFPGQVIAAPPCRMLNANMYGFFIKGNIVNIQQYIDETLNVVPLGKDRFQALMSYCMLTFTDIENIKPVTEPYASQGWFQETDIIIWIPVARMQGLKIKKIYWYPAFICVNNIYALVNGREIWGFNKYLCDYQMPSIGADPDLFSMTVDAFTHFSPDTKMAPVELFRVEKVAAGEEKSLADLSELLKEGFDLMRAEVDCFKLDLEDLAKLVADFFHPQVDQLLLKQFPDGEGQNAVYQKLVHSPSVVQKLHDIKLYGHAFEFTLNQVDMFPLQEMFGIQVGTQSSVLNFNVLFDFNQQAAFELTSED